MLQSRWDFSREQSISLNDTFFFFLPVAEICKDFATLCKMSASARFHVNQRCTVRCNLLIPTQSSHLWLPATCLSTRLHLQDIPATGQHNTHPVTDRLSACGILTDKHSNWYVSYQSLSSHGCVPADFFYCRRTADRFPEQKFTQRDAPAQNITERDVRCQEFWHCSFHCNSSSAEGGKQLLALDSYEVKRRAASAKMHRQDFGPKHGHLKVCHVTAVRGWLIEIIWETFWFGQSKSSKVKGQPVK